MKIKIVKIILCMFFPILVYAQPKKWNYCPPFMVCEGVGDAQQCKLPKGADSGWIVSGKTPGYFKPDVNYMLLYVTSSSRGVFCNYGYKTGTSTYQVSFFSSEFRAQSGGPLSKWDEKLQTCGTATDPLPSDNQRNSYCPLTRG